MKKYKLMQLFRLESIGSIDRVLLKDIKDLVDWSNKMGMRGIEVSDLQIEKSQDTLDLTNRASCELHLNEGKNELEA